MVSDAQSPAALMAWNKMACFAIQNAQAATIASALSAGNIAQVVSAMTASFARKAAFLVGVREARLTGVSPAPRRHMDAELEQPWDVLTMKTKVSDSVMICAHLAGEVRVWNALN